MALKWQHKRFFRYLEWGLLAGLALYMTWPGLHQGIGYIPEEVRRVSIAIQIAQTGDLNPHWFGHPASLLIYGLTAIYKSLSLLGSWNVVDAGWKDLRATYLADPSPFFLAGRVLARLAAVAAVIATLEVGARIMARPWAFVAAALTAMNPVFITNANRLRSDHILTFFLLLGVAMISTTALSAKPSHAQVRTGAFAGMAITYKYFASSILVAQLAVIWSSDLSTRIKRRSTLNVVGAAALFSFLFSPFLWLDLPTALRDIFWEATKKKFQWNPFLSIEKIVTITRYGFGDLGSLILLGVACLALWRLMRAKRAEVKTAIRMAGEKPYHALVLVLLVYLGSTMLSTRWNTVWMGPLVPFIAILLVNESVRWCVKLSARFSASTTASRTISLSLITLIIAATIASQLPEDHAIAMVRRSPTIMSRAESWIQSRIQPRSRILLWQPMKDQDGFFPRIKVPGATVLRVNEQGQLESVCEGEVISRYETTKKLTEEKCFPRPRVRSQGPDGASPSMEGIDFLITSSRKPTNIQLSSPSGVILQPAAVFERPKLHFRLSYPNPDSFPEGDYGLWRHIRIYAISPTAMPVAPVTQ